MSPSFEATVNHLEGFLPDPVAWGLLPDDAVEITADMPVNLLGDLIYALTGLEQRLRLAFVISLLDGADTTELGLRRLLKAYPRRRFPLSIQGLSHGSARVTVTADSVEEVAEALGLDVGRDLAQRRRWFSKFVIVLAILVGTSSIRIDIAETDILVPDSLAQTVDRVCEQLPAGSTVTVNVRVVEVTVVCAND